MSDFVQQEDCFPDWENIPEKEKAACEAESQAAGRDDTEIDDFFTWRQKYHVYTEDYLRQIREIPLLSAEEEKALFLRLAEGEEQARTKLIVSNLRLAAHLARKHSDKSRSMLDDMIQEGNEALIEAVDRFDASQGFRFSTYAVWIIKKAVLDEKSRQGKLIALPKSLLDLIRRVENAETELEMLYGRRPTAEQIAYRLGIPVEKVRKAQELANGEILPLEAIPGEAVQDDGD